MLIVLEGCDGVGKSTLAEKLAGIINAEIIHCSSKTPNDREFFESIIETSRHKNIIADRFCYGQFVYQKEEDRPLGSVKELNRLEVKMLEAGVKIVLVTAPVKEVQRRLDFRREKILNNLEVEEVMEGFKDVLKNQSILGDNILLWDTGGAYN